MKNTGTDFELNVKSLTLENVFKLNLQNFPEMVTEICTEASNEAKNEIEISNIEQVWKSTNFELAIVSKGGEETCILKSNEEVK
jgi:dynein heavy chain